MPDWLVTIVVLVAGTIPFVIVGAAFRGTTQVLTGLFAPFQSLSWPAGVQEEDGIRFDMTAWRTEPGSHATRTVTDDSAPASPIEIEELEEASTPTVRVHPGGTHVVPA